MMKIYFEYGRDACVLPKIDKKVLARAGKTELRLLLALSADPILLNSFEERADELALSMKVSRNTLDNALSFWIGAGVISTADKVAEENTVESFEPRALLKVKVTELPEYTRDELTAVLERRRELKVLIEEAQAILGKVLNITEAELLVRISEGLGLDDEYILNLLAYCKSIGKSNMRYVEKTAVSFYDKGICTAGALVEHLRMLDRISSAEGKIRGIFGMGERAFTAKESKFISDWINVYGFDFDVIKKAYEDTVNATSKPSLNYANRILESWYSEGLRTLSDVEKFKEKKNVGASATATSFNVDDFFTAAINKGFGESPKKED